MNDKTESHSINRVMSWRIKVPLQVWGEMERNFVKSRDEERLRHFHEGIQTYQSRACETAINTECP